MTMYLTLVKQYPQYGGAFFDVQYKGYWSLPNRLLLSIDVHGFKFVHLMTKDILKEFVVPLFLVLLRIFFLFDRSPNQSFALAHKSSSLGVVALKISNRVFVPDA